MVGSLAVPCTLYALEVKPFQIRRAPTAHHACGVKLHGELLVLDDQVVRSDPRNFYMCGTLEKRFP